MYIASPRPCSNNYISGRERKKKGIGMEGEGRRWERKEEGERNRGTVNNIL